MQIRHSNLLAQAHFLQTKAEPKLVRLNENTALERADLFQYYKPWELLPGDEDRIKSQVEEADRTIARENSQHEADHSSDVPPPLEAKKDENAEVEKSVSSPSETVGPNTNEKETISSPQHKKDANTEGSTEPELDAKTKVQSETAKDQGDDGGEEMLEGEEDTVIY